MADALRVADTPVLREAAWHLFHLNAFFIFKNKKQKSLQTKNWARAMSIVWIETDKPTKLPQQSPPMDGLELGLLARKTVRKLFAARSGVQLSPLRPVSLLSFTVVVAVLHETLGLQAWLVRSHRLPCLGSLQQAPPSGGSGGAGYGRCNARQWLTGQCRFSLVRRPMNLAPTIQSCACRG